MSGLRGAGPLAAGLLAADTASVSTGYVRLPWAGPRPLVDSTIPAGTTVAQYQVKALRANLQSPWSEPASLRFTADATAGTSSLRIAA